METQNSKRFAARLNTQGHRNGSALFMVVISLLILFALGAGMLKVGYGARLRAIRLKNETTAMLAAEAGYEQAIFWMSQQPDMPSALQQGVEGTSGTLNFPEGDCSYQISFFTFIGGRPVYRVTSTGQSGIFRRVVDVQVLQAMSGWDMGQCRIPSGATGTNRVYFVDGEIIDLPVQINSLDDDPDDKDINISGSPQFLQPVGMGESRYTTPEGADKYSGVMDLFDGGIYFDQPDSKIVDEGDVQTKVDRFRDSTKPEFRFTPSGAAPITNPNSAVHLEFFVEGDVGKVRITNNCTVRGFQQDSIDKTWDLKIQPGSGGSQFERYNIYAYHLMPEDADATGERSVQIIDETYVTQSIGGVESEPGGQIYVDGNVIIGSGDSALPGQDKMKGKMTVVATGNIWIADSIVSDGEHDADGKPSLDNPNVLGLVAQGVIKVVDPGMSDYSYVDDEPVEPEDFDYVPIGRPDDEEKDNHKRHLPEQMVVEAALTVGGGGWGAENVSRGSYGGIKETPGIGGWPKLVLRGAITEAIRGTVGNSDDGYDKNYYFDPRLVEGVLPGDMWFRGKFIPAPAGWREYRPAN